MRVVERPGKTPDGRRAPPWCALWKVHSHCGKRWGAWTRFSVGTEADAHRETRRQRRGVYTNWAAALSAWVRRYGSHLPDPALHLRRDRWNECKRGGRHSPQSGYTPESASGRRALRLSHLPPVGPAAGGVPLVLKVIVVLVAILFTDVAGGASLFFGFRHSPADLRVVGPDCDPDHATTARSLTRTVTPTPTSTRTLDAHVYSDRHPNATSTPTATWT